ncbi:MAG: 5,10-methylenetetrahydrofolate reductase [Bacteroidota bacterium]|nr:5,10-methylenetetrahydrofolate reductase [Bacteroidota bacterium]
MTTLDPYHYSSKFLHDLDTPKIIYKSVGKYKKEDLQSWVQEIQGKPVAGVFVGAPSKYYLGEMKLNEAYQLCKNANTSSILGGVSIFERHNANKSEHLKIIKKMEQGCSFFITQCVFNIGYAKDVLSELYYYCLVKGIELPTIIFTLTTCGSRKTIDFMDWLGIHFPGWLRNELYHSQDILAKSIDLSLEIAEEVMDFCISKSIPFGINVESVSIRKEEIEASVDLFDRVEKIMQLRLLPALLETK